MPKLGQSIEEMDDTDVFLALLTSGCFTPHELATLSTEQVGAHSRLLTAYFRTGTLPLSNEVLAKIVGVPVRKWLRIHQALIPLYGPQWSHDRLEALRRGYLRLN